MGKNSELTSDQKHALAAYLRWQGKHGRPPSVRELARELGIKHAGAHYYIVTLKEKGALTPQRITETRLLVSAKGRKAL